MLSVPILLPYSQMAGSCSSPYDKSNSPWEDVVVSRMIEMNLVEDNAFNFSCSAVGTLTGVDRDVVNIPLILRSFPFMLF